MYMTAMPRKKPLDEVSRYLGYRFAELHSSGESYEQIGKKIGVSHAQISEVAREIKGAGDQTREGAAKEWFGRSTDKLKEAAAQWAKEHPQRWVEKPDRYSNLSETIRWARGEYPDKFLDEMQQVGLKSDYDRTKTEWGDWLKAEYGPWKRRHRDPGYAEQEAAKNQEFTDRLGDEIEDRLRRGREMIEARKRGEPPPKGGPKKKGK